MFQLLPHLRPAPISVCFRLAGRGHEQWHNHCGQFTVSNHISEWGWCVYTDIYINTYTTVVVKFIFLMNFKLEFITRV